MIEPGEAIKLMRLAADDDEKARCQRILDFSRQQLGQYGVPSVIVDRMINQTIEAARVMGAMQHSRRTFENQLATINSMCANIQTANKQGNLAALGLMERN